MLLTIALLFTAGSLLSSCAPATLTATGSGTVTITSNRAAVNDGVNETVAYVCAAGTASCWNSGTHLYTYYPATGEMQWSVSPGFPVRDRLGQTVGLPAGSYTVQATDTRSTGGPTNSVTAEIFGSDERDLTIWHQGYGRSASDSTCTEGWQPSWAQWPNEGSGGFVCNRQVYAYYPDEPVR